MAVLVLLYHKTPSAAPKSEWDVALSNFKEQVDRLVDSGVQFIKFREADDPALLSTGRHVAITFDDGHDSNVPAIEYLAAKGVRPTTFIVKNFAERGSDIWGEAGYSSPDRLRQLAGVCDLGSHAVTHRSLVSLSDLELHSELSESRDFLAEVSGQPPETLALPGGEGGVREQRAAREHGYALVGDSVYDINERREATAHRVTIKAFDDNTLPVRLAHQASWKWAARRARHRTLRTVESTLGAGLYGRVRRGLSKRGAYAEP